MNRQTQDVFSQMFLRLVRMRSRRKLPTLLTPDDAPPSSLLASGRPVWKCPDRVFSLQYSRWAAINTLQVIANNLSCTSCHSSCLSKDSLVIMNNSAINFADLITPCGSYNKFTASPDDTILRNWKLLTFLGSPASNEIKDLRVLVVVDKDHLYGPCEPAHILIRLLLRNFFKCLFLMRNYVWKHQ